MSDLRQQHTQLVGVKSNRILLNYYYSKGALDYRDTILERLQKAGIEVEDDEVLKLILDIELIPPLDAQSL